MSDNIFEAKLGWGPFKINLLALWQRLARKEFTGVELTAHRFLGLFEMHGVVRTQIPQLIPQLALKDVASEKALVPALTQDVLRSAANLFGVRREWLDGVGGRIYERIGCYKQPARFFETLHDLQLEEYTFAVRAFTSRRKLDYHSPLRQPIVLVLLKKIHDLGDSEIFRCQVFGDAWDWSHAPGRIQLKAMVRVIEKSYGTPIPLHVIDDRALSEIREGRKVPIIQACPLTNLLVILAHARQLAFLITCTPPSAYGTICSSVRSLSMAPQ